MQAVSVLPLWRCLERRGGPDVYVTEYFRVHRDSKPEKEILRSITEFETNKPIIAQMIGNLPDQVARTAVQLQDMSPCAGIDVNLGCPAPTVCGKNAGGALLKNHDLIRSLAEGLRPVVRGKLTLKTRVGFETPDEFAHLLELFASLPIDGLAIHGRTVREKYQSEVHTDLIAEAVQRLPFPVSANGNIVSQETAKAMAEKTNAAGLMIGRGGIRNPWLFGQISDSLQGRPVFRPRLQDVWEFIQELMDELQSFKPFEKDTQLVNRMKKFTNYIVSGVHEGECNYQLRRSTKLDEFVAICRDHLESDEFFPEEPEEDGKLFCGFAALRSADSRL